MARSCTLSDWIVYWYMRIAGPAADAQILHGLEEGGSHRQTVQLGAQAVDDLSGTDVALRQRLERNVDGAGIGGPTAAA